ncbi:hypothetical protein OCU04_013114 [Sclerotinia nivalis]|uniref:Uncharacterized protein n=1 Tax=Sclerotinia nivalis TaxID=352851 RepID=A0A9X0A7Z8_9HELO|nr:hypothetical protein OCU04_013114 [Sclerotinia nivalis]
MGVIGLLTIDCKAEGKYDAYAIDGIWYIRLADDEFECWNKSEQRSPENNILRSSERRTAHACDRQHGALLKDDGDIDEDDDGTYLLRRGSLESREEWLARKQIIASRIRGSSESDVGVKMWKNYSIDGGKGQL